MLLPACHHTTHDEGNVRDLREQRIGGGIIGGGNKGQAGEG